MLRLIPNTSSVDYIPRPPLIYLDTCAYIELEKKPRLLECFRRQLAVNGTILFSLFNIQQLGQGDSDSRKKLIPVWDAIGENWAPMQSNIERVIHDEQNMVPRAWYDGHLYNGLFPITPKRLTLHHGFKLFCKRRWREDLNKHFTECQLPMKQLLDRMHDDWQNDSERFKKNLRANAKKLKSRTERALNRILETYYASGSKVKKDDPVDIMHVFIPVASAGYVVLDGAWADRVRQALKGEMAKVIPIKEFSRFVSEGWH